MPKVVFESVDLRLERLKFIEQMIWTGCRTFNISENLHVNIVWSLLRYSNIFSVAERHLWKQKAMNKITFCEIVQVWARDDLVTWTPSGTFWVVASGRCQIQCRTNELWTEAAYIDKFRWTKHDTMPFPWIDNCLMATKWDFLEMEASVWLN